MIPFLVTGLLTSRLYSFYAEKAAWLYAFDLGGAAIGLFGVLLLLDHLSAASTGFALGILAAGAALLFAENRKEDRIFPGVALLLTLGLLTVNLTFRLIDLPQVRSGNIPPDKTMFQVLASNSSAKSSIRPSVLMHVWISSPLAISSQMFAFTNAGAGSYMLAYNGDLNSLAWLKNQVEFLPFLNQPPPGR